ncbi:MAG: tetratricopeptide repeat protein [Myxococcota bacterium]
MSVERIQSKVWNGERLTDEELNELTRAAQREGGPTLRTTVAQALINADHHQQAISLLLAVRRDFPREAQVHLALGRALISLEKWSEAEEPLQRALELNPRDPEPLKALATLALRRLELAKARDLLQLVLRQDPFDSEAQLLFSEVEAAQPADSQSPTLEDFTRTLSEVLKAQSTPFLLQKDAVLIRLGRGGVARFDLDSLFREARRIGQDFDSAVALIGRDFAERSLGLPPGKLQLLSKVLPVLRDSTFLERAAGAVRREGPAGLWFFYAVEDPEVVLYVPEGVLSAMRVDLEQLDTAAWKNLEARPAEVRAIELEQGALRLSATPTGLWALAHGDGHDAARVLTPSHQAALEKAAGPGPWRVYLGLRELVLLCRESDAVSVKKLEGLEAAREGITGAWRLHEGRLTPLPEWDV